MIKIVLKRIFVISLPLLGGILANLAVSANLKHFCLIKFFSEHECWGCGLTRAFAALTRFEFAKAYDYNHLIVVFVPLLFCLWVYLIWQTWQSK